VRRIVNDRAAWLVLTLSALAGAGGCSAMHPAAAKSSPPAPPTPPALIALLPDPESGITGRARVSNEFGAVNLAAPRASTIVNAGSPPGPVTVMSDAEVKRLFGGVLAALPPEPKHFTLYFKFESDALTDESSQKVPEILNAVKQLSVPEVVVVGHTDTLGDAAANIALGLKRAMTVLNVLVEAGIARTMIEVASHGEADLLIKTRNNVAEPRNRRVEISVR
jgi:outer membrane protein OmpA-like peptidoglycan-associated protein